MKILTKIRGKYKILMNINGSLIQIKNFNKNYSKALLFFNDARVNLKNTIKISKHHKIH